MLLPDLLLVLVLLQIKHWYVDFVNQSEEEVASKGIYGDPAGVNHSIKQGIGTLVAVILIAGYPYIGWACMLASIDFFLHYHIDWAKININKKFNYTIKDKQFWAWLGADQLAHQLTYLSLVWVMFA